MDTLKLVNFLISVLFFICYAYQFLYIPIALLKRPDKAIASSSSLHRFAVLICARNEADVIGKLIDSIHAQRYPQNYITVFVMADNCTDDTAAIARARGAQVYTRQSSTHIGKGYALNALQAHIMEDYPAGFDGYIVFDADNLLSPDYISEMNKTFSQGHDVITSYRNSKNYGENWISAGYGLWFLRESRYLNHARSLLGTSCAVSGTGFLYSQRVASEIGAWPFHTLTEDIEFSVHEIVNGRTIAFCCNAELFDEQPVCFSQSWHQRMRWTKGYIQVFRKFGTKLIRGTVHGSFSCFDMSMAIMPAFILSALSVTCNISVGIWGALIGDSIMIAIHSIGQLFFNMYLTLFAIGAITTISEWSHIRTSKWRKILYSFTFPLFMFTYIPISIAALFCRVEWKPIQHRGQGDGALVPSTRRNNR